MQHRTAGGAPQSSSGTPTPPSASGPVPVHAPKQEQERDDIVAAPRRGVVDDAMPPMVTPRPPRSCRLGSCHRVGRRRVCCRLLI